MEEETVPEQPVAVSSSNSPQSQPQEERSCYQGPKIILCVLTGLLLLLASASAGYWYGIKATREKQQVTRQIQKLTPIPTPLPTPTPAPKASVEETDDWKSYRNEEAETKYSFRYPEGWTSSREHKDVEGETRQAYDTTTLTRNGYKIKIAQAMGSSASCLYPEDPNKEGMYARYGDYVELAVGGKILRRAKSTGSLSNRYVFCEEKGAEFVGTTSFGIIYYEVPEEESATVLKEMDFIIKSLTLIE